MRAPLFLLCIAALALSVTAAACFDWDGDLARCRDAGNCGASDGGGGGQDAASDGGDGGGGQDASTGDDGGVTRDGGGGQIGDPCTAPSDCGSNTCTGNRCICSFGGPCSRSFDCCKGEVCQGTTCGNDVLTPCGSTGASCGTPGGCCGGCDAGAVCTCSQSGMRCNDNGDCCAFAGTCSPGKFCCRQPGLSCTSGDQCCTLVCANNACL